MQAIKPTPSQAAVVLKNFLKEQGVEMKLSKAQEAVARLQGFANWQSLAGAMDPRVGVPDGSLRLLNGELPSQYELMTSNQTCAHIMVKNLHVEIKHEDEGVVVDIYPREVREDEPLESLGSTYAHFSEAELDTTDYSEAESHGSFTLVQQLLLGKYVCLSNSEGIRPMLNRNTALLKKMDFPGASLESPLGSEVDEAIAFSYIGNSEAKWDVPMGYVLEAVAEGRDNWRLPNGVVLTVYLESDGEADACRGPFGVGQGQTLAHQLLNGSFVDMTDSRGITPMLSRNDEKLSELAKVLSETFPWEGEFDGDREVVFSYKSIRGEERTVCAEEVFKAHHYGINGWRTEDGLEITVHARIQ